jgi:hypothetical protein
MGRPHIVGVAVLSTTLPKDTSFRQALEQRIKKKSGNRAIWYHGNRDAFYYGLSIFAG